MKHIPALDGLRGVAILLVMLFHLHLPGLALGWAGVPLFFVLSGFLITGILLEEKREAFPSYLRLFYAKRALRIFPLFYIYLAINFAILVVAHRPTEGYGWYLAYLQNYHIGLELHGDGRVPGILGHTWSLAVEEQFYLLWPFLVYFLGRRQLAWTCALLILASPIARWALLQNTDNVYLTIVTLPSCLDMMAYGSLLAIWRTSDVGPKVAYGLFAVGCALTGFAIHDLGVDAFWESKKWVPSAHYLYTALAFIFGAAIWAAATKPGTVLARVLTARPLLFTGKISYGLYIWHLIVFLAVDKLAARLHLTDVPAAVPVISLAAAYGIATLSFNLFERRFLRMKDRLAANKAAARLPGATA